MQSWTAVALDSDGDFTSFNTAEQAAIRDLWQRAAEDFAPFDVDVTTEEPATFGPRTIRSLITRSFDANGVDLPGASVLTFRLGSSAVLPPCCDGLT